MDNIREDIGDSLWYDLEDDIWDNANDTIEFRCKMFLWTHLRRRLENIITGDLLSVVNIIIQNQIEVE